MKRRAVGRRTAANHPLAGIKVIDLTRLLAGPYCTQLLADLGADVVKIEPPGGDDSRALGPPFIRGDTVFYLSVNGGKRSIRLDLTTPEARGIFFRLVRDADVVVENFRPDVKQRLGVDYRRVHAINPRAIYCSISAFGQRGPSRLRPGLDTVFQAMGGLMSLVGGDGKTPAKVASPIADITAGTMAAVAVMAALLGRVRSGRGQHVEVSILDSVIALLTPAAAHYLLTGKSPVSAGTASPFASPAGVFATRNGFLAVAVINDRQWLRLCKALRRPDLGEDRRFVTSSARHEHRDVLFRCLAEAFATRTAAAWDRALGAAGVPCGPVRDFRRVFADPQIIANRLAIPFRGRRLHGLRTVGVPFRLGSGLRTRSSPPRAGQHAAKVLKQLGLRAFSIRDLKRRHIAW